MKQFKLTLVLTVLMSMVGLQAYAAWDTSTKFQKNGLAYYLDKDNNLAQVTSKTSGNYTGNITIPSSFTYNSKNYSVTSIGDKAFYYCDGLTSVSIPNSVTSIGDQAFNSCRDLASVTIPNSVTSIGNSAFGGCEVLTSVTIPNSVKSIGDYAFGGCGLTSVTIGNSVTSIGSYAFNSCDGLTSVSIPNSVKSIGDHAFYDCYGLISVTIGNSVTSIGGSAFESCRKMESVTIPNSVTSIGSKAFKGCSKLESIEVESGNTKYDSRNNCNALIETASNTLIAGCKNTVIPNSVTSIGQYAFYFCRDLGTVTIPSGVTIIRNYAFYACYGLTSVTIPNGVIGNNTFQECSDLTTITIGSGVTSIGNAAFNACSKLTSVTVGINTPLTIGSGTIANCANATLYVPAGCKSAYEAATYWKDFKEIKEICKDMSSSDITINPISAVTYNGSAQTPTVTVKDGTMTLVNGTDYTVSYSNNINAGTATVTITGLENYTGTKSVTFTINKKNASVLDIFVSSEIVGDDLIYNGSAQTPAVTVKDGSTTLTSGTDYTLSYSNNINAGTATATITGKGNYTGSKSENFTINAKGMSGLSISNIESVTYNGSAHTPTVTVTDETTTLVENTDYTLHYSYNIHAGTAYVSITGTGNYKGSRGITFTINPKSVSSLTISPIAACSYTGSAQTPSLTVKDGTTTLTSGTDYTVSYSNNIYIGTATATITGKGDYTGTKSTTFIISKAAASITTAPTAMILVYTGSPQQLITAGVVSGGTMYYSSDGSTYSTTIPTGTNAGNYTVYYRAIGDSNHSNTNPETIDVYINAKQVSGLTINSIAAVTYNGSEQTPAVTVKDGTTTMTSGTHYTVAYSNNTNAGTATATITGKGNYTGTKNANFTINKATLTVTAKSYTIAQGDPLPTFECTYSGFKNSETASMLTTQPTISCSATSSSAPGTYNIIVSGGSATNYTFTYVNGTLTIEAVAVNNIQFADNTVKSICVAHWDTNGDGELSTDEAAAVTTISDYFFHKSSITSFDEFAYFTGLTSIDGDAFEACAGLTSITIPNSVTSIGSYAFRWCTGLTSVTIPNSVTSIGEGAFQNCRGLTSVTIPNSVTSIGRYVFEGCSGLTSIIVESGNTKYDSRNNCNAIIETASNTLVSGCICSTIPNSVTSIGGYAFSGCSGLTSITIPNNVTSIGGYAFLGCSGLTSMIVESGNTKYDSRNNCNAIIETATNKLISGCKNTVIPNSVTSIGGYAFAECSGLTSITIPNSVTSIGFSAFYGCSGLTSISIPNSVTSIEDGTFYGCSGLTSVTIGNSVTSIGEEAFRDCSALTSVTIPNSVTSIGFSAFYGCSGLTSVTVDINTPLWIATSYPFPNRYNATLYVPAGSKSAYEAASYWKEFKAIKEFPDPDVNQDGTVNVVDVVDIARFVVGTPRDVFVVFLADLNNSGEVNVADAVVLVNEIAGDTQFARQLRAPQQADNDVLTLCRIDDTRLSLQLDGSERYAAFQFDLWLPSDMDVMQLRLNDERRQGHQLLYNKVGDGHYRVVALSTSASAFNGTSGELLDLTFDGFATDEVRMDNIHFVTTNGTDVLFDAIGVTATGGTTAIHGTESTNEGIQPVYNLNGQRLKSPRKGINIIGGKKVVVK